MKRSRDFDMGFTLVEVLIVVVMMAVLAAVVLPQIGPSHHAQKATAEFHLGTLRSVLQSYRADHQGALPKITADQSLSEILTSRTTLHGIVETDAACGPYLADFPKNPFSGSNAVKQVANNPAAATDVSVGPTGGWLYNPATGGLWLDHERGYRW